MCCLPFHPQDRARHLGISDRESSMLLAVVGISNTVSRIVLGYISDQPWVNRLYLYNIALTICGIGLLHFQNFLHFKFYDEMT